MLVDRILDFPDRDVEHAMIPRPRVGTVRDADTLGQLRELMSSGHSRYPVLDATTGDVVGVVHLADLLTTPEPDTAPVTAIARECLVVSTFTPLPDALRQLTETENQMACVIDEYGGGACNITPGGPSGGGVSAKTDAQPARERTGGRAGAGEGGGGGGGGG